MGPCPSVGEGTSAGRARAIRPVVPERRRGHICGSKRARTDKDLLYSGKFLAIRGKNERAATGGKASHVGRRAIICRARPLLRREDFSSGCQKLPTIKEVPGLGRAEPGPSDQARLRAARVRRLYRRDVTKQTRLPRPVCVRFLVGFDRDVTKQTSLRRSLSTTVLVGFGRDVTKHLALLRPVCAQNWFLAWFWLKKGARKAGFGWFWSVLTQNRTSQFCWYFTSKIGWRKLSNFRQKIAAKRPK